MPCPRIYSEPYRSMTPTMRSAMTGITIDEGPSCKWLRYRAAAEMA